RPVAARHPPHATRRGARGVRPVRPARGDEDRPVPVKPEGGPRTVSATSPTLPEQLSDAARAFAAREHELLIAGEHAKAGDRRTFETLDPSTGNAITTVAHAGAQDVDRAVNAARKALSSPDWADISAAARA